MDAFLIKTENKEKIIISDNCIIINNISLFLYKEFGVKEKDFCKISYSYEDNKGLFTFENKYLNIKGSFKFINIIKS